MTAYLLNVWIYCEATERRRLPGAQRGGIVQMEGGWSSTDREFSAAQEQAKYHPPSIWIIPPLCALGKCLLSVAPQYSRIFNWKVVVFPKINQIMHVLPVYEERKILHGFSKTTNRCSSAKREMRCCTAVKHVIYLII